MIKKLFDPSKLIWELYLNVASNIKCQRGTICCTFEIDHPTFLLDAIQRRTPLVNDRPTIIFGADDTHLIQERILAY